MTWSILAKDPDTGYFGIAVASKFFAVGSHCPWSQGGAGIISTQALINPLLGHRGIELLGDGQDAATVLDTVISEDEGRLDRQFQVMDWQGKSAAYTGQKCIDWCGHFSHDNLSIAGNMLSGSAVIEETAKAYKDASDTDFVNRLLIAMEAGEAAGGDKRGKQAAVILIQGPEPYARMSLRADDHEDPLGELRRLAEVAKERFIPYSDAAFPTTEHPYGISDREIINAVIDRDAGKPLSSKTNSIKKPI